MDDDHYKRAQAAAVAPDTSFSASCQQLRSAAETEIERLNQQEREIRNRIAEFTASARLSREDAHDRRA